MKQREKFWTLNIGQLLPFVFWVAAFFITHGKLMEIVKSHENQIAEIRKTQIEVVTRKFPEINEKLTTAVNNIEWIKGYIEKMNRSALIDLNDKNFVLFKGDEKIYE